MCHTHEHPKPAANREIQLAPLWWRNEARTADLARPVQSPPRRGGHPGPVGTGRRVTKVGMSRENERVLVVEDDPAMQLLVTRSLTAAGFDVESVSTAGEAMRRLGPSFRGVVVLDHVLPDARGGELLPRLARCAPDAAVLMLTGRSSVELALTSLERGAFDFIDKSQLRHRLLPAVRAAAQSVRVAGLRPRADDDPFRKIVARSRSMGETFRVLEKALDTRIPVLVLGESGTGKELVARALHEGGPRARGELVAVNCAGIPANLLEAELFGYEKGAFTGATQRKLGRFDLASGGTLFLDEIGEMPPALQAKLLRVLQTGEYQRLGGERTLRADVRIVSATHRNLVDDVHAGRFREDLYYRLAVFTVELPALRERAGDIPLLVQHFIDKAARREGKVVDAIEPLALDVLERHTWPGNVRQLENVLSYAVVHTDGSCVGLGDLPRSFLSEVQRSDRADPVEEPVPVFGSGSEDTFPTLKEVESAHVARALLLAGGNKAKAARLLGVSRMTLYRKLEDGGQEEAV